MKPLNVGLLGFGTVGRGTWDVLRRNEEEITRRAGRPIRINWIATRTLDRAREGTRGIGGVNLTNDPAVVVRHPDVDIVCELIGGTDAARTLVLEAIANGKHVVTANKALLALHGNEIFAAASRQGRDGRVRGGGRGRHADHQGAARGTHRQPHRVDRRDHQRHVELHPVGDARNRRELRDRAGRGAEARLRRGRSRRSTSRASTPRTSSPSCRRSRSASRCSSTAPTRKGSASSTARTSAMPRSSGYRIKLLGITRRARSTAGRASSCACIRRWCRRKRLIANVEGAMNAVLVKGDAVGATLHYGAGAGAEPTASAVIADLVDVTRMHTADPEHRVPHLAFQPDQLTDVPFLPIGDVVTSYYLRMRVDDKPGVLADITRILADREISHRRDDPEGALGRRGPDRHHPAHAQDGREEHRRRDRARSRRCRRCAARSCASGSKSCN